MKHKIIFIQVSRQSYSRIHANIEFQMQILKWHNNVNNQPDATITDYIDNYNQLNMFRAIISPILRSTTLCLHLVV